MQVKHIIGQNWHQVVKLGRKEAMLFVKSVIGSNWPRYYQNQEKLLVRDAGDAIRQLNEFFGTEFEEPQKGPGGPTLGEFLGGREGGV